MADSLNGFSSYVSFQSGRHHDGDAGAAGRESVFISRPETARLAEAMPPARLILLRGQAAVGRVPALLAWTSCSIPNGLPTNWLGFTSLRAVLLGPQEWKQLDPAQQDAVLFWTASGGDLLFLDGAAEMLLPSGQSPVGLGGTRIGAVPTSWATSTC